MALLPREGPAYLALSPCKTYQQTSPPRLSFCSLSAFLSATHRARWYHSAFTAKHDCSRDHMLCISLDGTDTSLPWPAYLSSKVMHQTCRRQVADGLFAIGHGEYTPLRQHMLKNKNYSIHVSQHSHPTAYLSFDTLHWQS